MDDVWKIFDTFHPKKVNPSNEETHSCGCKEYYVNDGNITCKTCQNILGKYIYKDKYNQKRKHPKWIDLSLETRFKYYEMGSIPFHIEKQIVFLGRLMEL